MNGRFYISDSMKLKILEENGNDEEEILDENEFEDEDTEEDFDSEEEEDEEEEEKKPLRIHIFEILKDVIIAFIIVMIIIGGIYLYTGNWPPVVVVESKSMQISDTESFLGVIDTGDLVLVKSIESENDVISYIEGKRVGHETYSAYGDVLIYNKNGYEDITPVIHRAIIWLELNETTQNSFDAEELKHHKFGEDGVWYVKRNIGGVIENRWYDLHDHTLVLLDIGHKHVDLHINIQNIFGNFNERQVDPHGGFITLGDNNRNGYDQKTLRDEHDDFGRLLGPNQGNVVEPIEADWIVGKARGELPWFGLIKLWFQDSTITERAPENSFTMLYISIILIFAIPISIDVILMLYENKKAREKEEKEKEEGEEDEDEEEPPPDGENEPPSETNEGEPESPPPSPPPPP
jgi:signal peptidase